MEESVVICPLCGEETKNIKTSFDFKKRMTPIVSIISIASILVALLPYWTTFFLGIGIIVACIVFSFIIKSKAAIVISFLSAIGFTAILFYYGFFDAIF
jgi:hypothetical protein